MVLLPCFAPWNQKAVAAVTQSGSGAKAEMSAEPATNPLAIPPVEWAKAASANEIAIVQHPGSYLRYRERFVDAKGDETRDVIESSDGTVARLILRDNKPLTPEQDQAERDRLTSMLEHPSEFHHHVRSYLDAKGTAVSLLRLMPEAMLYSYVPGQPQTPESSARQVVIDFSPNPDFHPPTTVSEALMGLRGRAWIDERSKQVVRLEANIFQGINFGLGMLAHIYPGGKVDLEQTAVNGSRWNLTHFNEQVTMRLLMVKSMNVHTEVQTGQFQVIPGPISYQEAIHRLLDTPLPKQGDR